MPSKVKKQSWPPYWYRFYYGECPVCGRDASYKVRIYGKKPKNVLDRITYLTEQESYDHCMG